MIADDHAEMRASLRATLEAAGHIVCGEAEDASSALAVAVRERPDVAVLDVVMPGNGVVAAAQITARLPQCHVVMLTVSEEDEHLFAALRAGASGYLLKETAGERLPAVIESVVAGEVALPRALVGRVVDEFARRGARRSVVPGLRGMHRLSRRELEVLELLRQGLSTAEIAARLYVEPVTVRSHVSRIVKKLHLPNRGAVRDLPRQD